MSIKKKIITFLTLILVVVVALTFLTVVSVSKAILKENTEDLLIDTVQKNSGDIKYYYILSDDNKENYNQYIEYENGYLEIDDDFLNRTNDIVTGLYKSNGTLIYGENPLGNHICEKSFSNMKMQTISVDRVKYYLFDKKIAISGANELWIRSVVSEDAILDKIYSISRISFIILCIIIHLFVTASILILERLFKPIKKITEAAIKIGNSTDLKERINMGEGKDEFTILANQFDKMVDKLDVAFESEKRFTADASHELRTPVSVISAECEYILEEPREKEEYIEALQVIERQNKRLSVLVKDMLSLSRIENKKTAHQFIEFDFSSFVLEICNDMTVFEKENITLSYDIEENITIKGDKALLSQLLINLIENAYKYGKENGWIKVSLKKDNDNCILSVEDNGIGISEADKNKVFDRFFRSDKSRSKEGNGLGLALSSEIAKLHCGILTVESTPDVGSTFSFITKMSI